LLSLSRMILDLNTEPTRARPECQVSGWALRHGGCA
jgi:hypothetical protein